MERVASSCASLLAQRRGYSVAAAMVKQGAAASRSRAEDKVAKRVMGKTDVNTAAGDEKTPWVPDPITGCYRPAGGAREVDAADLRAQVLAKGAN